MALTVIATPIGNIKDITLRALESLRAADLVIGEEKKPLHRLFAALDLTQPKNVELLNEHSKPDEIRELVQLCRDHNVALITDCGTPGFCDPGAALVDQCRKAKIPVTANPGPASLTAFLSLCGRRLDQFYFQGFLPRDNDKRLKKLQQLDRYNRPFIIMDTPYRLEKTLSECSLVCKSRQAVVGLSLTQEGEKIIVGTVEKLLKEVRGQKQEFLLLIE